jgi:dynein heavy chain
MNLVSFSDAILHLIRILRAFRIYQGHALLIGLTGTGRQSLSKLAAFIKGL